MQVYSGFPQLLFTRSFTDEKALGSGAFCEEQREKETGVLRATVRPTYNPLPARITHRPAGRAATGWSDGAARRLRPPGVPLSPGHKAVAWVERPRAQPALLKAAGAARDLSGLVLPRA